LRLPNAQVGGVYIAVCIGVSLGAHGTGEYAQPALPNEKIIPIHVFVHVEVSTRAEHPPVFERLQAQDADERIDPRGARKWSPEYTSRSRPQQRVRTTAPHVGLLE
jgi:hypothetical protein